MRPSGVNLLSLKKYFSLRILTAVQEQIKMFTKCKNETYEENVTEINSSTNISEGYMREATCNLINSLS